MSGLLDDWISDVAAEELAAMDSTPTDPMDNLPSSEFPSITKGQEAQFRAAFATNATAIRLYVDELMRVGIAAQGAWLVAFDWAQTLHRKVSE